MNIAEVFSRLHVALAEHFDAYWRLYLSVFIFAVCVLLSFGGVWWAVHRSFCDTDGGRGGAIAVAVALFVIFLNQSYASSVFHLLSKHAPCAEPDNIPLTRAEVRKIAISEISRFTKLADADAKFQLFQNILLAAATFISTIFWGFGDLFARHYIGKCPG